MTSLRIRASYYQQFNADYSRPIPAEGYGGWKETELDLTLDRTAVVLMHAWDCLIPETAPGDWHACEYLSRAKPICERILPRLLTEVRRSGMPLFHVVGGGGYYETLPGYQRAVRLAGPPPPPPERLAGDPSLDKLWQFRTEQVWPGEQNAKDRKKTAHLTDFAPEARPCGDEGIAENSHQLFALCKNAGVNHLLYAGFAVGACLLVSPGGMVDMQRRGAMCSVLREAVTALENRETAAGEISKQIELWRVALSFGFVFGVDDLIAALIQNRGDQL